MDTLLLDTSTWDLVQDALGNIAVAGEPYSLAQDAASAIKTFLGECYLDTTYGVAYGLILGRNYPLPLLKQQLEDVALTVPDVASAQVFISSINARAVAGQVQVVGTSGVTSVATFTAANPQGAG